MATETSYESKVTANIDSVLYHKVMEQFHYGQRTIFFRKIFNSLQLLIDSDEFNKVTDYLYNEADLILPGN
jgi:hypothetical protein